MGKKKEIQMRRKIEIERKEGRAMLMEEEKGRGGIPRAETRRKGGS